MRPERPGSARSSDELVDQVLEHLLAAGDVPGSLALGKDVVFEVGERDRSGFDVRADGSAEILVTAPQTIEHYLALMVTLEPISEANGPSERIVLEMQL